MKLDRVTTWLVAIAQLFAAWLQVLVSGGTPPEWARNFTLIGGSGLLALCQVCVLALVFVERRQSSNAAPENLNRRRTPKWLIIPIFVCIAAVLISSYAWYRSATVDLRVTGSNTIGSDLMPSLVKAYMRQRGYSDLRVHSGSKDSELVVEGVSEDHKKVRIDIWAPGSEVGMSELLAHRADIAMLSRKINESEVNKIGCEPRTLAQVCETTIAMDAVAVIVNKMNPVSSLSMQQLADIFSGTEKTWQSFGGGGNIRLFWRGKDSGTTSVFRSLVFGESGFDFPKDAKEIKENQALADAVAQDPYAIGFVGRTFIDPAKLVKIGSSAPTDKEVRATTYPLSRYLNLYVRHNDQSSLSTDLINFIRSDAGQRVVQQTEFLSLIIRGPGPLSTESTHDPAMSDAAKRNGWTQYETTFHFDFDKAILNNLGLQDLSRLLDFLRSFSGKPVSLALRGFSDSSGVSEVKQQISVERSNAVRDVVEQQLLLNKVERVTLCPAVGLSDSIQILPGNSVENRRFNRRVEAWYRIGNSCSLN